MLFTKTIQKFTDSRAVSADRIQNQLISRFISEFNGCRCIKLVQSHRQATGCRNIKRHIFFPPIFNQGNIGVCSCCYLFCHASIISNSQNYISSMLQS